MIRRTMLFTVREDAAAAAVADLESLTRAAVGEIEGVTRIAIGRNEAPGPWSHVWDMDVADVETVRRYGPSPYHMDVLVPIFNPASDKALVSKLDYLWYEAIASAAEGVDDPIRRVMFFQMDESATEAQTAELEEMLQELGGTHRRATELGAVAAARGGQPLGVDALLGDGVRRPRRPRRLQQRLLPPRNRHTLFPRPRKKDRLRRGIGHLPPRLGPHHGLVPLPLAPSSSVPSRRGDPCGRPPALLCGGPLTDR